MAHCQEYISAVNVLVSALDAGILPEKANTKDFAARLPSAVKNQALRDAHSLFKRSFELGRLPLLKKPLSGVWTSRTPTVQFLLQPGEFH
ncbi:hypothetical protein KSD_46380 [Ktedonobacter sp. SOSP1-85]|nr:hypothetical protein KSD_46380 [Ktedonobacter sp. SOSP1-85]